MEAYECYFDGCDEYFYLSKDLVESYGLNQEKELSEDDLRNILYSITEPFDAEQIIRMIHTLNGDRKILFTTVECKLRHFNLDYLDLKRIVRQKHELDPNKVLLINAYIVE